MLYRQGHVEPFTVVEGPDAWTAADYRGTERHVYRLTPGDIAEVNAALATVKRRGLPIQVQHYPNMSCNHAAIIVPQTHWCRRSCAVCMQSSAGYAYGPMLQVSLKGELDCPCRCLVGHQAKGLPAADAGPQAGGDPGGGPHRPRLPAHQVPSWFI